MDRTADFMSMVQQESAALGGQAATRAAPPPPPPSQLAQRVGTISKALHETSLKLAQLTKMVRHRGMLRDASTAINSLTVGIKRDITTLDEHLRALERSPVPGPPALAAHRHSMVDTLQHKLCSTTADFHAILKDRTAAIASVSQRQAVFGGAAALGKPLAYTAAPAAPTDEQTPLLPQGSPRGGGGATAPRAEDAFAQVNLQAVSASRGTQQYFDARAQEAAAVEGMVREMGGLFQRLAGLVAEQDAAVARLEDQSASALEALEAGQRELVRHHEAVSDSRWLAAKVAGVLVTFGVVFTIFIAHALRPLAPVAMAYNPSTSGHGPSTQHFTDSLYTYLQYVKLTRSGGASQATPTSAGALPTKPEPPGAIPTLAYDFEEDRRVAGVIERSLRADANEEETWASMRG